MRHMAERQCRPCREAGVYDRVKNNLVLGENISQAAEFVRVRSRAGGNSWNIDGAFGCNARERKILGSADGYLSGDGAGRNHSSSCPRIRESGRRAIFHARSAISAVSRRSGPLRNYGRTTMTSVDFISA